MSTGTSSPTQKLKRFLYAPASPLTPVKPLLSKAQEAVQIQTGPVFVPPLSISSKRDSPAMTDNVKDTAAPIKSPGSASDNPGKKKKGGGKANQASDKGGAKSPPPGENRGGDSKGSSSPRASGGGGDGGSSVASPSNRQTGMDQNGPDDGSLTSVSPSLSAMGGKTVVVTAEELVSNVKESLVAQRRRSLERKGEQLTIMCIGEAGSGKTTLAQSLFVQPIPKRSIGTKSTVDIEESVMDMVMGQGDATVKVHLRMVDSPGYGDDIDVESSFKRVTDYIEAGFDRVLDLEKKINRPDYGALNAAVGVDAILYFIAPHRLKRLDIEFLKRIHKRASVLPVISKADTMTSEELAAFRGEVIQQLADENIETFSDPFAVICCAVSNEPDSSGVVSYSRGREYPWGTALADDPTHSDLPLLRQTLLTDGLLELHQARTEKFELYRREKELRLQSGYHGIVGNLRRVRRWALGIAIHTIFGLVFIKGMQMQLQNKSGEKVEEEEAGEQLVNDRARGRGFFGRNKDKTEPVAPSQARDRR